LPLPATPPPDLCRHPDVLPDARWPSARPVKCIHLRRSADASAPRMEDFNLDLAERPFDLGYTLDSGQVFRWTEKNGWRCGVVGNGVLRLRQEGYSLVCSSGGSDHLGPEFVLNYLRLNDDLSVIFSSITKDDLITRAVQRFYGLRLLRQDIWECLVSFVISTNANIPRIKGMVSNICQKFGATIRFDGAEYKLFPTADSLAEVSIAELTACGLGYRAKFVKDIAETVASGAVNLEELRLQDYTRAKEILLERFLEGKRFPGIGRKVADCILLFSCGKDEAFPIDVWIARVLTAHYPHLFAPEIASRLASQPSGRGSLPESAYEGMGGSMRRYFGRYAGYAQQYLYHYARMGSE
jgi:N-glycosylase/DNA lyase